MAVSFAHFLGALGASAPVAVRRDAAALTRTDLRSPFAPATVEGPAAHVIAGLRLVGVRVAADPARSGAVLILESGEQRAFTVGDEVAPGAVLAGIHNDHVLLASGGGLWRLALRRADASPGSEASDAPEELGPDHLDAVADASSAETAAWLAAILIDQSPGADGWRVAGPAPALAAEAGLRDGDVILAVNGVGRAGGAEVLAAASEPVIELSVLRAGGERVTIVFARDARS